MNSSSVLTNEELNLALKFCRIHLDGAWQNVTLDEIDVQRVSGGMTNLLYRCTLKDAKLANEEKNSPRQVLLRIYGRSQGDMTTQLAIFNQLAASNLGPILYSSFNEGRFEEYLPSSPLTWSQLTDEFISETIAKKIASIHKLDVQSSLDKNSNWLIEKYNHYNKFIEFTRNIPLTFKENTLESTKKIANELVAIDYKPEIEYLKNIFNNLNQPLVFSHNDLHQNNIILLHDSEKIRNDRIVLIDFEYSSYNYQAFDIANHLSEWCFDYNEDEYPYFNASLDKFPSEDRQRQFLADYLNALNGTNGEQLVVANSQLDIQFGSSRCDKFEILYEEMQPLFMASNLLWCVWGIKRARESKITFGFWEFAKYKWDIYLLCKRNYQKRANGHICATAHVCSNTSEINI